MRRALSSIGAGGTLLTALAGCGGNHLPAEAPPAAPATIAFTDVTVVPTTGGGEIPHQNVIVRGDRIARVDASPPPPGATRIDGKGKYLMPGLADMHVHLPADGPDSEIERIALLSLLNGVTTLRSMQGAPGHLAFREKVRRGSPPSPELYLGGPPLAETLTPEQARDRVRTQKAAGYDFVKVLGGFDRATYDALIDEARVVGMPVVGHVPAEVGIEAALASKQLTIEHLMGYGEAAKEGDAALDTIAQRTRRAQVWNCPTLDYFAIPREDPAELEARDGLAYVPEREKQQWRKREPPPVDGAAVMARLRREVLALQRAGAGLLVGSDAPGPWILPGFGFGEEMRELRKAGLTPPEVIAAATRSAAEALGRGAEDGTVQAGGIADLILLGADPLADVTNAVRPEVVMVRGRAWTREEIEKRLAPAAGTGPGAE